MKAANNMHVELIYFKTHMYSSSSFHPISDLCSFNSLSSKWRRQKIMLLHSRKTETCRYAIMFTLVKIVYTVQMLDVMCLIWCIHNLTLCWSLKILQTFSESMEKSFFSPKDQCKVLPRILRMRCKCYCWTGRK